MLKLLIWILSSFGNGKNRLWLQLNSQKRTEYIILKIVYEENDFSNISVLENEVGLIFGMYSAFNIKTENMFSLVTIYSEIWITT